MFTFLFFLLLLFLEKRENEKEKRIVTRNDRKGEEYRVVDSHREKEWWGQRHVRTGWEVRLLSQTEKGKGTVSTKWTAG